MKRLHVVFAASALLAAGPALAAHEAGETGFQLGARAAYAMPFGEVSGAPGADFDDLFDSAIPLWLEANYRLSRNLAIGAYFQYAFGQNADEIVGVDDGTDTRLGAQLNLRLAQRGSVLPWVGAGVGWEWVTFDRDAGGELSLDGFDFMVQGGADFKVSPNFSVGPFAALTFGQFRTFEDENPLTDDDIDDKGFHEWLQLGLRGTFDF